LPHRFATIRLTTLDDAARAIATMQVRGAPLIGATAAYGVCLALRADASDEALERAVAKLMATRPTAINLKWALDEMVGAVRNRPRDDRLQPRIGARPKSATRTLPSTRPSAAMAPG
jgi:Predicted translation initiation factor 2B subunit, eIF-2B alpha/beta/delta family